MRAIFLIKHLQQNHCKYFRIKLTKYVRDFITTSFFNTTEMNCRYEQDPNNHLHHK